jgi:hypothetical protein
MRSLLVSACLVALPFPAQEAGANAPAAAQTLDKGHLDPTWFKLPAAAFAPHDLADFGWVKPGFTLGGRSLHVTWEAPRWTEPNTDPDNLKAAEAHRGNFPAYLREALGGLEGVKVSAEAGELQLVGRLVECNTKGGFLSYAIEGITYDLKLVDPATGETLAAFHNRLLGGLGAHGNGSRRRFLDWSGKFAAYAKAHWLP